MLKILINLELPHNYLKKFCVRVDKKQNDSVPAEISSKKLRDLGFSYDYSIQDIIQHTVRACKDYGFLQIM